MKKHSILLGIAILWSVSPVLGDSISLQDPRKHLVLDVRAIKPVLEGELVVGTPTKHPKNPLLRADQPWENSLNNLYANVLFDPKTKLFKMWYGCVLSDKDAIAKMDPPRTVHDVGWYELYATSEDGISWKRPEVGIHAFGGSKANNAVVRDTPNVGVFRDTNPKCPPDRLYKMIYDVGQGKMRVRFSPDGIQWGEPLEAKGFGPRTGDTHNNAFWDARLGKYVLITRFYLGERLVARAESDDFLEWKDEKLIVRSNIDEGKQRQCYCMPAFAYGNGYFGFLMMYNVGTDRTVDCELAWSPDSLTWHRVQPGVPFLPRGEGKSYDSKCIYAQANPPILREGMLHIYYGGSDTPHLGWKRHCNPCLATLPVDRFVGLRPKNPKSPITVTSYPMAWQNSDLRVSADVEEGGSVEVKLTTLKGDVVAESEAVTARVSDTPIRWKSPPDRKKIEGENLVVSFKLDRATLYAFHGPELVKSTTPTTPKASPRLAWEKLNPGKPKPVVRAEAKFEGDGEGWLAIEKAEHRREPGKAEGFIRGFRSEGQPYLFADDKSSGGKFSGNWTKRFGGSGVRISFKTRAAKPGGSTRLEVFAKDISQWSYDRLPKATPDWQTFSLTLRYDWTDAEAETAGWRKAIHGFSWRDTVTHVGRLVIAPMVQPMGDATYDLDDVLVETIYE